MLEEEVMRLQSRSSDDPAVQGDELHRVRNEKKILKEELEDMNRTKAENEKLRKEVN